MYDVMHDLYTPPLSCFLRPLPLECGPNRKCNYTNLNGGVCFEERLASKLVFKRRTDSLEMGKDAVILKVIVIRSIYVFTIKQNSKSMTQ